MPNDLEEFLRRAAEKRRAALQAVRETAAEETRPHRAATERTIAPEVMEFDEPVVEAIPVRNTAPVVTAVPVDDVFGDAIPVAAVAEPLTPRRSAGRQAPARPRPKKPTPTDAFEPPESTGEQRDDAFIAELRRRLRRPEGLREALLLREIMDRPTYRW